MTRDLHVPAAAGSGFVCRICGGSQQQQQQQLLERGGRRRAWSSKNFAREPEYDREQSRAPLAR